MKFSVCHVGIGHNIRFWRVYNSLFVKGLPDKKMSKM